MAKNVNIKLGANIQDFQSKMKRVQNSFKKTARSLKKTGRTMTMTLTAPLTAFAAASVKAFDTQAKAIAQVNQGLKTTGGQVGRTSKELQQMAADLQTKTLFGDEVILKDATAQLLTFTNITGKQFDRTQVAALDLATRLDGDLKSASIQLGKALNDPIANLSALSRSGIQFSEDQKEVIKSLADSGRLAEAQTIILDELEKQYGGSAEAAAKAGAGGLKQLSNRFSDLMEKIGEKLIPMLNHLISFIDKSINAWNNLDGSIQVAIITIGVLVALTGPVLTLAGAFATLWAAITGPVGIAIAALAALSVAFVYIQENYEGVKERFSDVSWWKNALISMLQFFVDFAADIIGGYNKMLIFFKQSPVSNPFLAISDDLEKLKDKTKDYKNELGSLGDAISNKFNETLAFFSGKGSDIGIGTGGGANGNVDVNKEDQENPLDTIQNKLQSIKNIAQELSNTIADSLSSSFATAVTSGENFGQSMISIFKDIAKQIIAMIIKAMVLAALFTYLGIGDANGMSRSVGFFKNFETSLTGKAGGGGVVAGQPYMVGEKGPEMFMPGQSGTIIPNQNIGGSIIPDVRISGDDLLIVFDKAKRRKERR
tara:strand:- start:3471 stop:5267 length:1797 start_codon:yes stop_codon:yes gene_type:complete